MPQSKKETTAKNIKSKASAAGKTQKAKPIAADVAAKKPEASKRIVSKTASEKPKAATTRKKVVEEAKGPKKTDKNRLVRMDVESHKASPAGQEQTAQKTQKVDSKSTTADAGPVKAKKKEAELADSINQGLAKSGQKKRGWRDIEALTERARLKSLLSDIWHEDIDLDSDIFGETNLSSGYYTDKEEEIEVEDDADEDWEEFEEDED